MLARPPHRQRPGQQSRRQVRPGLLCHHVGGVPGGPVLVVAGPVKQVRPPIALLVLGVCGLGTKVYCSEAAVSAVYNCMRVVGVASYTKDLAPLERIMRDAMAFPLYD